jgi:PKD repeat protein
MKKIFSWSVRIFPVCREEGCSMIFSVRNARVGVLGVVLLCGLIVSAAGALDPVVPSDTPASRAPVASFTASATSGQSHLNVVFTDTSTNTPTSWSWSFNNDTRKDTWTLFSTSRNPTAMFGIGNFSIRLKASNTYGFNISSQTTIITVRAPSPDSRGMTYFPPDHVWNYPVSQLPVNNYSDHWIQGIADYSIARCTAGTFCHSRPTNVWVYAQIPINWVDSSVKHTNVTSWYPNNPPRGNSDWLPAPFTPTLQVQNDPGQDDNILIIVDTDEKKAYEFFQAKKASDNTWSCAGEFVWNLTKDYRIQPDPVHHPPNGLASASASGVPIIAGLIKYDELNALQINHAVAGVIRRVNFSVLWPGSYRIQSNSEYNDNTYPPYSARLRLKSSVNTSSMGLQAKAIAEAMKTYGVIIRDTGSYGLSITLEKDDRIDPRGSNMSGLSDLTLYDFEFVDESSLEINSTTARVNTRSEYRGSGAPVPLLSGNPTLVKPTETLQANETTTGSPTAPVQPTDTRTGSSTDWTWFFEYLNHLWRLIFPGNADG